VKEGWFQAHRLLTWPSAAGPPPTVDEIAQEYARMMRGEVLNVAERADLERRRVAALTRGESSTAAPNPGRAEARDRRLPAHPDNRSFSCQGILC
jgi:hypothetical protein